jgi:Kdo2-lipid IVA lauroyltransferase/acyltransferase
LGRWSRRTVGRTDRRNLLTRALDVIAWWFTRAFVGLVRRVPRETALYGGRLLGRLAWRLLSSRVRVARSNMKRAGLPIAVAESSFAHFGQAIAESLLLPDSPPVFRWHADTTAQRVLSDSTPAAFLSAHVGNWELAAWALAQRMEASHPLHLVVASPHNSHIASFLHQHRLRCGCLSVDRTASPRRILRLLADGVSIGTAADQWPGGSSIDVPFFGVKTPFTSGIFRLALHANVPILSISAIRACDGSFDVDLRTVRDTSEPTHDLSDLVARWAEMIESTIRTNPEQYLWMHRRWKDRPSASA